jgi:NitT/TauT family transport system ATP-binding protein
MKDAVICKALAKWYPGAGAPALRDFNFRVAPGEFVCLVGPSGCGKSTVLRLIAGLESPSDGEVLVHGEMPLKKRAELAMVFQSAALLPWLSALDNSGFGLAMRGMPRRQWEPIATQALATVGLDACAAQFPRELSGGMRQRVGIARALATDCKVLLLDEPTSALDPHTSAKLREDLLAIWQKRKMTVVMVSHSLEETLLLADRVAVVRNGKIDREFSINEGRPRHMTNQSLQRLLALLEAAMDSGASAPAALLENP